MNGKGVPRRERERKCYPSYTFILFIITFGNSVDAREYDMGIEYTCAHFQHVPNKPQCPNEVNQPGDQLHFKKKKRSSVQVYEHLLCSQFAFAFTLAFKASFNPRVRAICPFSPTSCRFIAEGNRHVSIDFLPFSANKQSIHQDTYTHIYTLSTRQYSV